MARREHPRYETTEWPDYEYREFPMMVYVDKKAKKVLPKPTDHPQWDPGNHRSRRWVQDEVTVNSQEELDALIKTVETGGDVQTVKSGPGASARLKTPEDERLELIAEADVMGVRVDKRWSVERLREAIEAFKADEDVPV